MSSIILISLLANLSTHLEKEAERHKEESKYSLKVASELRREITRIEECEEVIVEEKVKKGWQPDVKRI